MLDDDYPPIYQTLTQIQIDIAEIKRDLSWTRDSVSSMRSDIDNLSHEIDVIKDFKSRIGGIAASVSLVITAAITIITNVFFK